MDNKMLTINKDLGLVCQPNKVLPNLTIDIIKVALLEKTRVRTLRAGPQTVKSTALLK